MDFEKRLKQAAMQISAGGTAGFVEICIMQPLDLVKTRLQIQSTKAIITSSDHHNYSGVVDCMRKMYRHEGLGSFWKGILPPILVATPIVAVKFLTFEQYKKFFMFGSSTPTPMTFILAGLGAGITESFIVNPFEVVKVTLQANRSTLTATPSAWSVCRQVVRENGFGAKGLNKGLSSTILRNGIGNMVYFGFYHNVVGYIPQQRDPTLEFLRKFAVGFMSGVAASCVNIPFDVVKSRIQGPQPVPGVIKYRTAIPTLLTVYKEEGVLALYKGLLPKVMRLGPGGAIVLVVYDYSYTFLNNRFM